MASKIQHGLLVGIDGGGSHTRVLCTDLCGNPLSYVESGGANPDHNADGEATVRGAIVEAIRRAEGKPGDVAAIVGGIAGYDDDHLLEPAAERLRPKGVEGPFKVVNDSIVAHAGAFGFGAGVLQVSGSGSMTAYIGEDRKIIRNYDFNHYAHSGGRHLGYGAVFSILNRKIDKLDEPLIEAAFTHFDVGSLVELHAYASENSQRDNKTMLRHYGRFAPRVTDAAAKGSPTAQYVCKCAAEEVAQAIALVASRKSPENCVKVVLHGGVNNCNYFRDIIVRLLMTDFVQRFDVVEPIMPPVAGAVLLASAQTKQCKPEIVMETLRNSDWKEIAKDRGK